MRKLYLLSLVIFCLAWTNGSAQNVAVNDNGNTADASAMLDVQSTSKGLLIPKMTAAQRAAIVSPANGLMVYQTDGQAGIYINQGISAAPNWVALNTSQPATYRWATFHTYDYTAWAANNDPLFFGGVNPSNWTDGNATAASLSSNKETLRTLFVNKGYAKSNAMIMNENWHSYSSTDGKVVMALFRIKNTTSSAIVWTPHFYYSAYGGWSEYASVALNGVNAWTSSGGTTNSGTSATSVGLSIPANRISTVIFVSTSGSPGGTIRNTRLIFGNNSLNLPAGLSFVDDLDTATGGWEQ